VARGRLITIEGIDGAGKSTLADALLPVLRARGERVESLREPGGVEAAERIRALLADPSLQIGAAAEALLYAAARAELVRERLRPLLAGGVSVLLDRYVDSSFAYQGAGRELGSAQVEAINRLATGGLLPDRTLLLRIPVDAARARLRARGAPPDRLEGEDGDFFERVSLAYERLLEHEPERVRPIDATESPATVLEQALVAIEDLLAAPAEGACPPEAPGGRGH